MRKFSANTSVLEKLAPTLFVLLWSTGFVGSKLGAPYSEPLTFLAIRFGLVLIALLLVTAIWKQKTLTGFDRIHCIVVGILIHGIYLGGVFWAIDRGMSVGMTALIIALQPIATSLFAIRMVGERAGAKHLIALLIGLFGVALVLGPKLEDATQALSFMNIAAVGLAVVVVSFGTVYQKKYVASAPIIPSLVYQYIGALFVCAIGSWVFEMQIITWTGEFIFALGWLVIVLSFGAIGLLMFMIRVGAVSHVAAVFYLVPAVSTAIGILMFDETIDIIQVSGILITMVAVLLVNSVIKLPSFISRKVF